MELLTVKELQKILKISHATLYNYISQGMPKEINKPPRFKLDDVLEWLKKRK